MEKDQPKNTLNPEELRYEQQLEQLDKNETFRVSESNLLRSMNNYI